MKVKAFRNVSVLSILIHMVIAMPIKIPGRWGEVKMADC
jgi:hypothetical protein